MTTLSNATRPVLTLRPTARPALIQPRRILDLLQVWQDRGRGRRELAGLDDALLKDIGRSRADVDPEIRKPFWRR